MYFFLFRLLYVYYFRMMPSILTNSITPADHPKLSHTITEVPPWLILGAMHFGLKCCPAFRRVNKGCFIQIIGVPNYLTKESSKFCFLFVLKCNRFRRCSNLRWGFFSTMHPKVPFSFNESLRISEAVFKRFCLDRNEIYWTSDSDVFLDRPAGFRSRYDFVSIRLSDAVGIPNFETLMILTIFTIELPTPSYSFGLSSSCRQYFFIFVALFAITATVLV